jgi:hypothetical protein
MTASVAAAMMGGVASSPPSTLQAFCDFNNGDSAFFVNGATGELVAAFGAPGVLRFGATGGTPPYNTTAFSIIVQSQTVPADSVSFYVHSPYTTIAWNLPNVGDLVAFTLEYSASDSGVPQQFSTVDAPAAGVYLIKRTS